MQAQKIDWLPRGVAAVGVAGLVGVSTLAGMPVGKADPVTTTVVAPEPAEPAVTEPEPVFEVTPEAEPPAPEPAPEPPPPPPPPQTTEAVAPPATPTLEVAPPPPADPPPPQTTAVTTVAPTTTSAAPVTTSAAPPPETTSPPVTSEEEVEPTTTSNPVTTTATTAATSAPSETETLNPESSASATTTASESAEMPTSTAVESETETESESETATSTQSSVAQTESETSASSTAATTATSSLIQQAIAQATPEVQQAEVENVALAKAAVPILKDPEPASEQEVEDLRAEVFGGRPDGQGPGATPPPANMSGDRGQRPPRQWNRDWVQYDRYYRPIICNPFKETLKVVYIYQGAPRVVYVPPLVSVSVEVRQAGAYNFTAVRVNAFGVSVDVSVGAFFGGGYAPPPGQPLPPPPPPVVPCRQVVVVVKYTKVVYRPVVVRQIIDVGYDERYRAHKVLLDGVTPVWGTWRERPGPGNVGGHFEAHTTQRFPGLIDEPPGEHPVVGYQLAVNEENGGIHPGVWAAGGAVGTLFIGGLLWRVSRRNKPAHAGNGPADIPPMEYPPYNPR